MPLNDTRIPLLLAAIAAAAMIGLTAWQGYSFWQAEGQKSQQASNGPTDAAAVGDEQGPPDVELASLDLFGKAGESTGPTDIDTENLPETNLRLFLRGVLAADGEFPGSALIEDEKSKTEAYLVGDELPGNAELRSVHANRVIIARDGKLENLYFPEVDNREGVDFAANTNGDDETSPAAQESPNASPETSAPANDDQRREEIRRRLEQLRERLRNNNS
ncbi:type II secretion system protein N [Marinobacter sp.]|uniref:type II secretion system protein N n=1 Tax=Marinobacter sp. TaxID=50741 RepID=UPI0034A20013